jgi:hypothetical protein
MLGMVACSSYKALAPIYTRRAHHGRMRAYMLRVRMRTAVPWQNEEDSRKRAI